MKIFKKNNVFELLTNIYLTIILLLFPFFMSKNTYYNVLETKWNFYVIISTIYILLILGIYIYYDAFKKDGYVKNIKINKPSKFAIVYLIIIVLSTFLSPFLKNNNLIIGVGRREGLFVNIIYVLSFIMVSTFLKPSKKILFFFPITSILLSLIAIFQHFGINIFGLYHSFVGMANGSYITTIGNIDTVSAWYTILLPITIGMFLFLNNNIKEKVILLISIFTSIFVLTYMGVLSGILALSASFILLLPFLIKEKGNAKKLLAVVSITLMSFSICKIVVPKYDNFYNLSIIFNTKLKYILLLMISLIIMLMSNIKNIDFKIKNKKTYYIILLILTIIGIILLYLLPLKNGFFYEIHEILHGNIKDEFGTYRIFLWKRALSLLPNRILLGSGPDTFSLRFMGAYTNDLIMLDIYSINDTAANVYLTMLINIGIIGLLSYLTLIASILKQVINEMKKSQISIIFLYAIITFLIQDFFNLNVVIITPIWWIILALSLKYNNFIDNKKEK